MKQEKNTNRGEILLLSGGGPKGAFQVGMLKALAELGVIQRPTRIYGVSVGAINSFMLGYLMNNKDLSFKDAVYELERFYIKYGQAESVFDKNNIMKVAFNYFIRDKYTGLYNLKPLEQNLSFETGAIIREEVPVYVGTVNLHTGEYVNIKLNGLRKREAIKWVIASASVPMAMDLPAIYYNGKEQVFCDGGAKNIIPEITKDLSAISQEAYDKIIAIATIPYPPYGSKQKAFAELIIRELPTLVDKRLIDNDDFEFYVKEFIINNAQNQCCKRVKGGYSYRDIAKAVMSSVYESLAYNDIEEMLIFARKHNKELYLFRPPVKLKIDFFKFNIEDTQRLIRFGYITALNYALFSLS